MQDNNTQEPRAPDADENITDAAGRGKVKRGKTRDAFAFRDFGDTLIDFNIFYDEWDGKDQDLFFETLPTMNAKVVESVEWLDKLHRRITNHLVRLTKYQAKYIEKIGQSGFITGQIKEKTTRVAKLKTYYVELMLRVKVTKRELEEILKDNELIAKRLFLNEFSTRLKKARKAAGLTQAELATRIGIKRSTYGQFEQGRNEPNVSILPLLSRVLNRPVEWFFGK